MRIQTRLGWSSSSAGYVSGSISRFSIDLTVLQPSLPYTVHRHLRSPTPPLHATSRSTIHTPHTGSIPCFALATYNYGPGAVWAYGVRMHLLDEETREVLESEGSGVDDQGLSVYVRMTRYDGRGLMALLGGGA
jgi:hypothetical protein